MGRSSALRPRQGGAGARAWCAPSRVAALLGCLASVLLGCARLPEVATGECGNGVIEPPEDCDGFGADTGAACRPQGSVGECHFDCSRDAQGAASRCPSGWGCDEGGICRRPTGTFAGLREYEVGSAAALLSGDFDGDGRADLVSLEPPDRIGSTRARFHYFDERAELRDTREFTRGMFWPSVGELSGDARTDVVFTDFRVGVLLGRVDRSWVPEAFSSYRIRDTSIRTLGVFDGAVQQTSGFVVFASFAGTPGVYVPDSSNAGVPRLLSALPGPNEALAGDPVRGRIIEDVVASPCAQVIFAMRGESSFSMLDVCTRDSSTGAPVWSATSSNIDLLPPSGVDSAPQIVDLNGDTHLDVLIGAGGIAYAAYGDGAALAAAVPFELPLTDESPLPRQIRMPLAAGDLTADGGLELVFDNEILFSAPSGTPGRYDYTSSGPLDPGFWRVASIGDFNGDEHADLVAASPERTGIEFFNGSSSLEFTQFRVGTARPVQHLVTGDFDGDHISDLALSQLGAPGEGPSTILISFGTYSGPPLEPTRVARLEGIEQLSPYREGGRDHLIVASSEGSGEDRQAALALLFGGGDRVPVALYELTSFAADGSTQGSAALRAVAGRFGAADSRDVLAIAVDATLPLGNHLEFWLLPALAVAEGTPVHLEGQLPEGVLAIAGEGATAVLRVSLIAFDADGDGRDEVALAAPMVGDESCNLAVMGVDETRMVLRSSSIVPQPCVASELRAFDADADGSPDLALLGGREGFGEAQLSVLWNDGAGGFDASSRSVVADAAVSPRAFAPLSPTPVQNQSFAYTTGAELRMAIRGDGTREFGDGIMTIPIENCTGIEAADLNGDGALDLALATSGNVAVLEALLENL